MIDGIDLHILNIIQNDGRISNAKLARRLQMAPSSVLERVRKLEQKGILEGYEVRLNPAKLGLTVTAFIHILTSDSVGSTSVGEKLAEFLWLHQPSGRSTITAFPSPGRNDARGMACFQYFKRLCLGVSSWAESRV